MRRKLLILLYFVTLLSLNTYSQGNKMGILVYFKDGLITDQKAVTGTNIKKARIKKASLQKSFENMVISEDSIYAALPKFNQSDTLRILDDGRKIKQPDMSKLYRINLKKGSDIYKTINQLKSLSEVLYAESDCIAKPEIKPNDSKYEDWQWNLDSEIRTAASIHMEKAWDICTGNSNNIIAIVDGGVDITHEDLKDKIAGGDIGVGAGTEWLDHGTEVAGIAAAKTNNTIGIAGVDWNARILPKRIDSGGLATYYQAIVDAVNFSPNVVVLNNSYSLQDGNGNLADGSLTLREAVAYAYKNNRVFVSVTGNHQESQPNVTAYPGGYNHVIAVGATNEAAQISDESGNGNYIAVCAPGINLVSTRNGGNLYTYSATGTSFAAPQVSGIASLLKGYNPNLANDDIVNIINLSATKVPDMKGSNFNTVFGYGLVNAEQALKYLVSPYTLVQQTAVSGTLISTSSSSTVAFIGASSLPDANYIVKKIEIQKTVVLPDNIYNIVGAWGRGVFSTGWSPEEPNFGEGFCEVVPGSLTNTSMTLRTYVYDVTSLLGVHLGYYPVSPANATFAYSVLGLIKPTITGSSQICDQGTYTINNLPTGATLAWSATPANIVSYPTTGNPVTLTKVGNGLITLTATINSNLAISMPVSVGAPWSFSISNYSNLTMYDANDFKILPGSGYNPYEGVLSLLDGSGLATSYAWTEISNTSGKPLHWLATGGSVDVSTKFANATLLLKCTASNSCGSYSQYYTFTTGDIVPLIITPNPGSAQVEVSIGEAPITNSPISISGNLSVISYSVKVVDSFGVTVYTTNTTEKKFTIPTLSFRNGIYVVIISDGINVYQNKLIVKH